MQPIISRTAHSDLDAIWNYVADESGNHEIARKFVHELTKRFFLLSTNPYLGRRRDDLSSNGLRSFPVGDYLIFYRINKSSVRILRVIHGSRNLQRLFLHD